MLQNTKVKASMGHTVSVCLPFTAFLQHPVQPIEALLRVCWDNWKQKLFFYLNLHPDLYPVKFQSWDSMFSGQKKHLGNIWAGLAMLAVSLVDSLSLQLKAVSRPHTRNSIFKGALLFLDLLVSLKFTVIKCCLKKIGFGMCPHFIQRGKPTL